MEGGKLIAAAAAARSESGRRHPPGPKAAPWLVFPHGKRFKDQAFYNLCEPSNVKTCLKSIPEMRRKSYWQSPSHQGWLVIACDDDESKIDPYSNSIWKFGDCFLWNPVSLKTIQLPSLLNWIQSDRYYIRDCVLSNNPDDGDSMVLFLLKAGDDNSSTPDLIVVCRPRDEQWNTLELSRKLYAKRLFSFKGEFFVECIYGVKTMVKKLVPDNEILSITPFFFDVDYEILFSDQIPSPISGSFVLSKIHYVESCDELFLVNKIFNPKGHEEVVGIQIVRLDLSLMAWVEVKSLGDHVLFVGENTTASCSATEMGLTRGCVFYTQPNDKSLYAFDPEDGTIEVFLPYQNLSTPWSSPEWMIMPTTTRHTDKRRTRDILSDDREEDNLTWGEENKTSVKNDEKEVEQKSNGEAQDEIIWCIFNEDILKLIASYLPPVDYMHLRAVCKASRSAIPVVHWRTSYTNIPQTTSLSPWLVFFRPKDATYNFVNPMHKSEKYRMHLPELLLDAQIRFSKGGWLLMSKGKNTLFFFNPFTGAMIQLPDLPGDESYTFAGITFSSLPTSSDCIIFAITDWAPEQICLSLIKRGRDSWTYEYFQNTKLPTKRKCMEFKPRLNNPVFYDGIFYCLDYNGTLGVFDLKEDDEPWKVLANPQRPCSSIYRSFLVECEGKLLSVFLGNLGKSVQIFRLDFSKMVWVKVESLGKHMLFISHTSCLSAIAPNSHMENKIYFPRFHDDEILFYSLETGRYHNIGSQEYSAQDFYNTKEHLYCSWIEPNWSRIVDNQKLDWLQTID